MARSQSQVGVLVPVTESSEEDDSRPKLPVIVGGNVIGRDDIPVEDKRLSRKHLSLSASEDGSVELVVEGTNPVAIRSSNNRRKLSSKERAIIKDGDIVELIPGCYLFKYVVLIDKKGWFHSNKKNGEGEMFNQGKGSGEKRVERESNDEGLVDEHRAKRSMARGGSSGNLISVHTQPNKQKASSRNVEPSISQFQFHDEKLPLTFRLMRVQGLPAWANTSCVSIGDVIQGDVIVAILSNYMVDLDWLLSACPLLKKVPHVMVVHGEGDDRQEYMKRNKPGNWILHKPPLPILYGTHHSKAMLLVYPKGVRVIVHTANLIHVDWNNKSQGLWMQDFPWKDHVNAGSVSGFESDLIDYLNVLKWPEFTANMPALGSFKINASFFKKFDYTDAAVRLVASVPGYHSGPYLRKWGHMKLRSILEKCSFDQEFEKSSLVYQFSSLGSLDEKWMTELRSSLSAGSTDDKKPLGLGEPLIIWPTVEDVRWSLEGYAAGSAIPSPQKNVKKDFLQKYWAKWKANHTGRCKAMPHIKTFTRYNGQSLAWFLLTSSNLSKAAWGALQKNNSQLMIRSYELGALFLPSTTLKKRYSFSCTDHKYSHKNISETSGNASTKRYKLVTLAWEGDRDKDTDSREVVRLPVPYELPPRRYSSKDVPWSWDCRYQEKDAHGKVWPR